MNIEKSNDRIKINSFNNNKEINYNKKLTLKVVQRIFSLLDIKENIIITVDSELPVSSGLGSSAGFSVALINTLVKRYKLNFSEEKKFKIAMEAEKIFHGATLGIDIIATMLQKPFILSIEKNNYLEESRLKTEFPKIILLKENVLKVKQITNNLNLHFLLISSEEKPKTKTMVKKIKQFSIKNKKRFSKIKEEYKQIIKKAENLINNQENKEKSFAELINKNHELLKELGLSNTNIEKVITLAKTNGALAAKITGAGNGGYILALVKKIEISHLTEIFIKNGHNVIECDI